MGGHRKKGAAGSGKPPATLSRSAEKRLKKAEEAKQAALSGFSRFYIEQYGPQRWRTLSAALSQPVRHCAFINRYADEDFTRKLLEVDTGCTIPYLPGVLFNAFVKAPHAAELDVKYGATGDKTDDATVAEHQAVSESTASLCPTLDIPEDVSTEVDSEGGAVIQTGIADNIFNFAELCNTTPLTTQLVEECAASVATAAEAEAEDPASSKNVDSDAKDEDGLLEEEHHPMSSGWAPPGVSSSVDPITGLCCYYPLDAASLLPVELLNVTPDCKVLDLCAAPGGKSLSILQRLGPGGSLHCNDISPERRIRLKTVIRRYTPKPLASIVQVVGYDATKGRLMDDFPEGSFDRVLLDAPCSSERHLIHKPSELMSWAPGRSKGNAERQLSLLVAALRLVRVGGRVVYSTCSLSRFENDDVVRKASRRTNSNSNEVGSSEIRVCKIDISKLPFGEATELGCHILPDLSDGWGPIYFSVLEKIAV